MRSLFILTPSAIPQDGCFGGAENYIAGFALNGRPILRQLFRDGIIQRLVDGGLLIETLPTSLKIDGYEMVVSHRHVPFASYPEEWCPAMLKVAALTKIRAAYGTCKIRVYSKRRPSLEHFV